MGDRPPRYTKFVLYEAKAKEEVICKLVCTLTHIMCHLNKHKILSGTKKNNQFFLKDSWNPYPKYIVKTPILEYAHLYTLTLKFSNILKPPDGYCNQM